LTCRQKNLPMASPKDRPNGNEHNRKMPGDVSSLSHVRSLCGLTLHFLADRFHPELRCPMNIMRALR
jgi:hypothetical protein